jgi:acetyl esterase/lipase
MSPCPVQARTERPCTEPGHVERRRTERRHTPQGRTEPGHAERRHAERRRTGRGGAAVAEEWLTVADGPTGTIPVRVLRPRAAGGSLGGVLPVVLYVHGAGWVFETADTHDRLATQLAVDAGVAVVFVEYDRSRWARYAIALEQVYAAARWVAAHGVDHGLDGARIAVAGGGMAAALTLLADERGEPHLAYQVLFHPATDVAFAAESYHRFASPLRASGGRLAGLPPTLLVTAAADALADEGEAYAVRLRQAGVPVRVARCESSPGGGPPAGAGWGGDPAGAAIGQIVTALRAALA